MKLFYVAAYEGSQQGQKEERLSTGVGHLKPIMS